MSGSHIIAVGLSLVALLVSDKLSFPYTSAKFLGIVITLLVATFYVFEKKLSFSLVRSKSVTLSFLSLFVFTMLSLGLSKVGEHVSGVSLILLWALMSFTVSALAQYEGVLVFLKKLTLVQIPIIAFIYFYLAFNELYLKSPVRPFFGNPNVASNFLSITLLQFFFFLIIEKKPLFKKVVMVLSALGILLLFLLKARGPFLGFLVGSSVLFCLKTDILSWLRKTKPSQKALLLLASILLLGTLAYVLQRKGLESMAQRYSFWANTLCVIKDHPLGVGPGSFEYVFQHYDGKCVPALDAREGSLTRNPHNMFLEFFAEIGILGGLSFLAFLFFIFLELRKLLRTSRLEVSWVFSFASLLSCIGFFEFPQDTPYTLFFISILSGVALALLPSRPNPQSSYLRFVNLAGAFVLVFVFFTKAYSEYLTRHPGTNSHQSFQSACALNNENWRACVFLGLSYLQKDEYEKLDKLIMDLNKKFEGHHSLLHLKGTYALKRGDMRQACEEFKKYHLLFNRNTAKKEFLEKNCPPLP